MRLTDQSTGDYFFVKVVDEGYEPLVDIEVVAPTATPVRIFARKLFGRSR
jgi:hypothetical protein